MIKEIIFFCYGDSAKASTWSNVPFLFTKTLEEKGITIRRIDISPNKYLVKIWNILIVRLISVFYPKHIYTFDRTNFFIYLTNKKIKRAVMKYFHADYCIFTCFDFYNKYNNIPTLLFCDWTYNILIIDRLKRKPYPFELRFSHQQEQAINSANHVVSLFPVCAKKMKEQYPSAHISYLGKNVINSLYSKELDEKHIIEKKTMSHSLLFIGGKKYLEGAQKIIDALSHPFLHKYSKLELNIIGLKKEWLNNCPDNVHCYGYLKKDIEKQRKLYYDLLLSSKVIINPTPLWAGYSSTIEAMFFYTPVIVSPYKDFVDEFGKEIDFGIYNKVFTKECLAKNICSIIQNPQYSQMCKKAHKKVEDYTWECYVDKLLSLIEH